MRRARPEPSGRRRTRCSTASFRPCGGAATRQHDAAVLALTSNISVIVGGPGTGKTHTIGALLAALAAEPSDDFPLVALCAPTGKAAARLGEAIANSRRRSMTRQFSERLATIQPSTIHRLLGWSRGRSQFRHSAAHRLPHDLVIVDEMSMVSLPLAAKLLAAVRDDASVVLVGDSSQLESIEAGTVLADIVGPLGGEPAAPAVVHAERRRSRATSPFSIGSTGSRPTA